jgi:hypothetical protein
VTNLWSFFHIINRTNLSAPLLLEGTWRIALVEVDISCTLSKTDAIYLYSDICGESIVDGQQRPLLRKLNETYITTTPATVVEETGKLENVVPVTDEEADNTLCYKLVNFVIGVKYY